MSLFEDMTFLNEGEQAEEYKARKAKEKEEQEKRDRNRIEDRAGYHRGTKEVIHGEYKDTDEFVDKKNGIRMDIGKKRISTPRSGSTNTHTINVPDHEEKYWDDDHPQGAVKRTGDYTVYTPSKEDKKRDKYASQAAKRSVKDIKDKEQREIEFNLRRDKINKDMRRHPEKWNKSHRESCGLFESVSFLND